VICVAGCGLHAFKVFGLRLPALPHRITTDQKAAISKAVVRAISVKTRKLTRQSDQILVPDDRERGAETAESGNSDLLPGKTLFALAICTPFPRDFRRRRGTVARASTFYERV
jgi:hypothetical protein